MVSELKMRNKIKKIGRYAIYHPKYVARYLHKKIKRLIFTLQHPYIFLKYPNEIFKDVKHFVFFVGHDRSGHSLVRAVLDAQPNIVVSSEVNTLFLLRLYHFNKARVFKLILENTRQWIKKEPHTYPYFIPGEHQGHYKKIEVIGDKNAEPSSRYLLKHPEMINQLIKHFGSSLKVINVVRNPYDNISSIAFRRNLKIQDEIDEYFCIMDIVLKLKKRLPRKQFYTIYHEELIKNKEKELKKLCAFLNQTITQESLMNCASLIYDKPHERRYKIKWSEENKKRVKEKIKSPKYRHILGRYTF